ncbi:MAG: biotin/lipoyl-binding protein [Planctomycetota bacterium]
MPTDAHPQGVEPLVLPVQHLVRRSNAGRKLAIVLTTMLVLLPVALILVPWQQTVPGSGRVAALDPLERIRTIPAPVSGRLEKLNVQEGARVREGEILAVIADLDPDREQRLSDGVAFAQNQLKAAEEEVNQYRTLVIQYQDEALAAVSKAEAAEDVAEDRFAALEAELVGLNADVTQKALDFERKKVLLEGRVGSQLDYELAENAHKRALANVEAQSKEISRAQNAIKEKREDVKRVRASADAKVSDAKAKEQGALQKVNSLEIRLNEAKTAFRRQATQTIEAPANGTVFRILGAATSDLIKANEPLIVFIPDTDQMAVEFWVRGVDAPLVSEGRKARLVFDGWPAVQFAGWPSTAVGTFGGIVQLRDSQAGPDGRVRMLVTPDPEDTPWPSEPFLLQGVRVTGWVQLDTVSSGYEVWRRLNAFPPTLQTAPPGESGSLEAKIFSDGSEGSQGK